MSPLRNTLRGHNPNTINQAVLSLQRIAPGGVIESVKLLIGRHLETVYAIDVIIAVHGDTTTAGAQALSVLLDADRKPTSFCLSTLNLYARYCPNGDPLRWAQLALRDAVVRATQIVIAGDNPSAPIKPAANVRPPTAVTMSPEVSANAEAARTAPPVTPVTPNRAVVKPAARPRTDAPARLGPSVAVQEPHPER